MYKMAMAGIVIFGIIGLVHGGTEWIVAVYESNDNLTWCINHKPMINSSMIEGIYFGNPRTEPRVTEQCFGKLWQEYCKHSYPEYCPNNNYSDYDRCLRSCEVYGTSPCPC